MLGPEHPLGRHVHDPSEEVALLGDRRRARHAKQRRGWRSTRRRLDALQPRSGAATAPAVVAHVSADRRADRRADAALGRGNRSGRRPQGRRREDHLPGGERLLAGDHAGLAVPPRAGSRTYRCPKSNRTPTGVRRSDHLPPGRPGSAAGPARRSAARRFGPGRRSRPTMAARSPKRKAPTIESTSRRRCSPTCTAA